MPPEKRRKLPFKWIGAATALGGLVAIVFAAYIVFGNNAEVPVTPLPSSAVPSAAVPPPTCTSPLSAWGNFCVSQPMVDYMVCVIASGGNAKKSKENATQAINAKLKAKAATVNLDAERERDVVQQIEKEFFSGGMDTCIRAYEKIQPKPPLTDAEKKQAYVRSAEWIDDLAVINKVLTYTGVNESGAVGYEKVSHESVVTIDPRHTTVRIQNTFYGTDKYTTWKRWQWEVCATEMELVSSKMEVSPIVGTVKLECKSGQCMQCTDETLDVDPEKSQVVNRKLARQASRNSAELIFYYGANTQYLSEFVAALTRIFSSDGSINTAMVYYARLLEEQRAKREAQRAKLADVK